MTDQVNGQVDAGADQGQDQGQMALGWRSALSDEFKEHDFVKGFEKPTDFVKAALDIKTEKEGLETRMKNAIFKPGKGATDDEITAFRKAMGIPDKAEDYDFPSGDGVEHDEQMISWAQKVFHEAGLSKEQGALIGQAWDGFVKGLVEQQEQSSAEAIKTASDKLKEEWGADFDKNMEFTKRGWQKFTDNEFDQFVDETGIGNHPTLIRFIFKIGQAMGEDFSGPAGPKTGEGEPNVGMNYEGMEHFK